MRVTESATPAAEPEVGGTDSGLFGRGLLYVAVWASQLLASTLVSPILAHLLGAAEFGSLATALSIFQVVSIVAVVGLDQALVLQRVEDGNSHRARGLIVTGAGIAVVVTGVALATEPHWIGLLGFTTPDSGRLVAVVLLWTAPAAAAQLMLSLLLAEDRLRAFSVVTIVTSAGGSVLGLVLLLAAVGASGSGGSGAAIAYAWGGVICQTAGVVLGVIATRPRPAGLRAVRVTARAVRLGVPLALGNIAYFVLNAGDRVIIQRDLGSAEVGRYQVAYVVGSAVILLLNFLSQAWTPRFAELAAGARARLATSSRDALYRILQPVVLGVTLASPFALGILAPASFGTETLTSVVFVIALTAFPVAAGGASERFLLVERRGAQLGAATGVAASSNVALNLVLVPTLGILGAALATLAAFTLQAVVQRAFLPRDAVWARPPRRLVLGCLAVAGVALASVALPQSTAWNLARLVPAIACVPWLLVVLRGARPAAPGPGGEAAVGEAAVGEAGPRTDPGHLHVLTTANSLGPVGGIETCLLEDSTALVGSGVEIDILYTTDGPHRGEFTKLGAGTVGGCRFTISPRSAFRDAVGFLRAVVSARRCRADLLWLNRPEFLLWGVLVARIARVPLVVHLHHAPRSRLVPVLASGVTRFVAVSEYMRGEWIAAGVDPDSITVIYNALPGGQYPFGGPVERLDARVDLGLPTKPVLVGYLGRVVRSKGVLTLLEAWALLDLDPADAVLVVVGDSPDEPDAEVEAAFDRLRPGSVLRMPARDDVVDVLHAVDLVVAPSWEPESFGRVVVEAMMTGRPAIGSAIGGTSEVLSGRLARFLVPPRDAAALAGRIESLLDWRTAEPELGAQCRERISARFPYRRHVDSLVGVLSATSAERRETVRRAA